MNKQQDLLASQHLFRRVGKLEKDRLERSKAELTSGGLESILWLGASGIGKSLSLVDILVQLVREMQPGRYVGFYKMGSFTIYSKAPSLVIKKRQLNIGYEQFKEIQLDGLGDDFVLVIDPPERVGDYEQWCPTLIALSTLLKEKDLETFMKGSVSYLAIDPRTQSEVKAIATCVTVSAADSDITYGKVMERYEKVGANLRIILAGRDKRYTDRLVAIEKTKVLDLTQEAADVNPMCVPKHYKFFVAPHNESAFKIGEEDKRGCEVFASAKEAKFVPWSDFTAERLRVLADTDTERKLMQSLINIGIPYVVEENAIQSFLLENKMADWDWYENVATGTVSPRVDNRPTLAVNRVVRFEGRYFKTKLSTLQTGILYKSSGWQMVLGDFFTVQSKGGTPESGMIVYMIQVSSRDPCDHPFKMDQYRKWRESLQMVEGTDDIVIIYATNKKHKRLHGLKFQDNNGDDGAARDVACPCKGYIVRTPMTPWAEWNQLEIEDGGVVWEDHNSATARRLVGWKVEKQRDKRKYRATSPSGTVYSSLGAAGKAFNRKQGATATATAVATKKQKQATQD